MKVRSGENRFRPHWLGALRGGSRGAHNSGKMFSIVHLEYFFGFGMFILGMTKVRPAPSRRSHRPASKKFSKSRPTPARLFNNHVAYRSLVNNHVVSSS